MTIRKFALFAALVALAAAPAYAQKSGGKAPAGEARTAIGPFVGINMSTISGSDYTGSSNHTGFMAGGMLQRNNPSGAFFRIGAKYSQRGVEFSQSGLSAKIKTSYLEVPASVGYEFAGTSVRPYVYAGGQVALKVGCDLEASFAGSSGSAACNDSSVTASSTDFGLLGGGGIAIPSGRGSIILDVRYLLGLQDAMKGWKGSNRGLTLGLGFMFPFGR